MPFCEYPLLNTPNLIALILREASAGTASAADCAARLGELLARSGEAPPVSAAKIRQRIQGLSRELTDARLLAPVAEDRFALTERGRAALEAHPAGFATDDLMVYPEYAAAVRARAKTAAGMDPHAARYDAGYAAYMNGLSPLDNPHPEDSADHLAWENGWSEALDDDTGNAGRP